MEGPNTQRGPKKMSHPHMAAPKHESGYTDEVAEECHDLIDHAEEDAHLHEPGSMYTTTDKPEHVHRMKAGLEGSGTKTGSGASATQKMEEKGKDMKSTIGEKMEQMKDKIPGMHK
ncbi:uncharacterized protein B0T15DRAFT_66418 [Chaetomium strumarium]|uniref:Uncharacterized protein n=1 Tax=Chaetomium strumarium TaxID=1170767 RepID=A0AAJ0M6T3_9PEZI|nr:hypothetical protein B0T15DRAFT_66418 [Chaetomium strumarium]